ncbi:unnamed protein product [Lathyrus sativus]|nr:unnamed protein product [Lathyrus sativus]
MNLTDLPVFGIRFTWFNYNGKSRSKLDRILVDDRVISMFSLKNQVVGDRDISDHRPVWLKSNLVNWGPKPFRTFNCWFYHKDFIPFITKSWSSYQVTGSYCSILTKKFQALKSDLRIWNLKVFGWLEVNVEDNIAKFNKLELESVEDSNPQAANLDREKLLYQEEMQKNLRIKESMLAQKSRVSWLQNGNLNTKFFHDSFKSRNRPNRLSAVRVGGRIMEDPEDIKFEAVKFFKGKYTQLNSAKFRSDFALAACLDVEDKFLLEADFSPTDVRKAVFNYDGNKCPDVDGFNFKFIKSCWDTVGQDLSNCILDFFKTGVLPKMFASSFISLVPKIFNPQQFEDFRPITLVSYITKVISKMLACILSKVIHKLISPSQTAFIPGRQIYDGILLANEITDYAKRFNKELLFFKADFAKSYDCVDWSYLDEMLVKMVFSPNWLKWIRGFVFNSYISILINGSPSKDFKVGRGLKQGDPLAPFLFAIVAEGLSCLVRAATAGNLLTEFKINDQASVSMLQFAYKTLLIGDGSVMNIWAFKAVMRVFELIFGLKINFSKNCLYGIGVDPAFLVAAEEFQHCKSGRLPFNFLGLLVGENHRRHSFWNPVLSRMRSKLSNWAGRNLSMGGRVSLINSVLANLPIHYLAFFKAPKKIVNDIIAIQRCFLWAGNFSKKFISWISWNSIYKPKEHRGLGIKHVGRFNCALIANGCGDLKAAEMKFGERRSISDTVT